jgi:chaperonin GroES
MSEAILPEGFQPTQDWILVELPKKEEDTEKKTDFGLLLIDDGNDLPDGPLRAEVVSVGPGYFDQNGNRVPMDIQVGDTVIYNAYSGTPFKENGVEYYFLNARSGSIIARIAKN